MSSYKVTWGSSSAEVTIDSDRAKIGGDFDFVKKIRTQIGASGLSWPYVSDSEFSDLIDSKFGWSLEVTSGGGPMTPPPDPPEPESVPEEEPEEPKKNTYSSKKRGKYRDG